MEKVGGLSYLQVQCDYALWTHTRPLNSECRLQIHLFDHLQDNFYQSHSSKYLLGEGGGAGVDNSKKYCFDDTLCEFWVLPEIEYHPNSLTKLQHFP